MVLYSGGDDNMKNTLYAVPEFILSEDIKRVRRKLNMSQSEFAKLIRSSKPTVERWEMSKDKITGPIVFLINMLDDNIDYVEEITIPEKEYNLRLYYMYKNKICTVIDVDTVKEKIKIKNFVKYFLFKAFGNNEKPTYKDYEQFLRDRCFPETRDKLHLVLEDLGLPFYDPFMIIEKTEGRMAEDDFWIKIER